MLKKLLIVDDEADTLRLVALMLERQGYLVVTAPTGQKALEMVKQEKPDLVLLDVMMPEIDGYEVARRLRQMDQTRNIPILAVSTSGNPEDKHLSIAVGCNDYIVKPIDVDRISKQIAAYL